jgi:hypothetical protein
MHRSLLCLNQRLLGAPSAKAKFSPFNWHLSDLNLRGKGNKRLKRSRSFSVVAYSLCELGIWEISHLARAACPAILVMQR